MTGVEPLLRVREYSTLLPSPLAGLILAEAGADTRSTDIEPGALALGAHDAMLAQRR